MDLAPWRTVQIRIMGTPSTGMDTLDATKNHDVIISVPKDEWKSGLKNAMEYYIKTEEYEVCSKIQKLIEKI